MARWWHLRRRPNEPALVGTYVRWLRPYWGAAGALLAMTLVGAALDMSEPLFMRYIVDHVLLDATLGIAARLRQLHVAGAMFLVLVVLSGAAKLVCDYRNRVLGVRITLALRRALFGRLVRLPLARIWEMKTGGILTRLTSDVETTGGLLQKAVLAPTVSAARLAIAIAVLFALNWRLAAVTLVILPATMFMSYAAARRVRPIYRSVRADAERIHGRVGEAFSAIRVVRAFGAEAHEQRTYVVGQHAVARKELFAFRRELGLQVAWGLVIAGVNVVIAWYGGYLTLDGRASVGDIMAFQWYTFLLLTPVYHIVNSFSELQRSLAATERVFDVLGTREDKPDRPNAQEAPRVVRVLRFEKVQFAYGDCPPAVCDFDLTVPRGAVVALVGRSGAGKTTVTDLVARFHDPTRGRITLNGIDIREFRLQSYRALLAIVQQDVCLFDGTVHENVAYGRPGATPAEVETACRRANAHEFVIRLSDGYGTCIGERGVTLSGGQRQRLSIARALLADPEILVLDEATSNLDTESEELIHASMTELLAGRTAFVIAHRLSTIRRADIILVMDHGCVVERGTHEELMAARGLYYNMVCRQVGLS